MPYNIMQDSGGLTDQEALHRCGEIVILLIDSSPSQSVPSPFVSHILTVLL